MGAKLEIAKDRIIGDLLVRGFSATHSYLYDGVKTKEWYYTKQYAQTKLTVEISLTNMAYVRCYCPSNSSTPNILYFRSSIYNTSAPELIEELEKMIRAVESFESIALGS